MTQIKDYITGRDIDNVGPEQSRQQFEKSLVETKGYAKEDIRVDVPITVQFKGEDYTASVDLVVCIGETPVMAVTTVAGSIGSYEREILAAARLLYDNQIPYAVSTDARDAVIMDTLTGKQIGQGISAIPSRNHVALELNQMTAPPLAEDKVAGEMIIFRSFNLEKINR
ncbi:MAG: type I restriction enzyme HsdR N-terminal domain-containing protein [Desulfobacterales bacterium]|nr:type I restriction enzyme HsdR N-terminal domain-containing protein [Desulfobacterales bacterium]